jgi:NADH-quinone oxidoreductase E subunit
MSKDTKKRVDHTEAIAFSAEALVEYEEILPHYPERRAALMKVLWLAQREFGWISPSVEKYVADLMELPQAWVEGVVSFYTMYWRRPVGKTHLQLCTTLSCYLRGADDLLSAISKRLDIEPGQVTRDGRFSLERAECLGSCGTAPMMQINNDLYYENLNVEIVGEMLDRLERGEEV